MPQNDSIWSLLLIVLFAVLLTQLVLNYVSARKSQKEEEVPPKIVVRVRCEKGDYVHEREFREGDFVGRVEGVCPKCGSRMVIEAIYNVASRQRR